jgi:hypothetical protein
MSHSISLPSLIRFTVELSDILRFGTGNIKSVSFIGVVNCILYSCDSTDEDMIKRNRILKRLIK